MYLVMARTGAAGPKGISAFLVDKVSVSLATTSVETAFYEFIESGLHSEFCHDCKHSKLSE